QQTTDAKFRRHNRAASKAHSNSSASVQRSDPARLDSSQATASVFSDAVNASLMIQNGTANRQVMGWIHRFAGVSDDRACSEMGYCVCILIAGVRRLSIARVTIRQEMTVTLRSDGIEVDTRFTLEAS